MEPIEYVRLLRRRWRLLGACILVAGTVAWVTTPANPSDREVTYEATHTLLRDDSSTIPPPSLAQVALFVRTGDVPARVAERVGFDGTPGELARNVEVEPEETSGSIDITAAGSSQEAAAELANTFAEETLAFFGERAQAEQTEALDAANEEVARLQGEIDDLEDQIEAAGAGPTARLEAQRDAKVRQYGVALDEQTQLLNQPPPSAGYVSLAEAAAELATPRDGGFEAPRSRAARTAIALLLGFGLGLAAVLIAERFDPRIHTRESAAEAFGLPVVAEVPRTDTLRGRGPRPIATITQPMSAVAEAYRTLRSSILLTPVNRLGEHTAEPADDEEPQVVLVTSPAPGEGKTTTVANLAAAFAETGRTVLVLSCDFRRPEIHRFFDAPQTPGLSAVLNRSLRLQDVARTTPVPGVGLAADGGGLRRLGDLAAEGHELIAAARRLADIVLIDTAPVLATNDAAELIHAVDAVVVVCRSGGTTTESARRARVLLERLGTPVVGVALLGVPESESAYATYYAPSEPATHRPKISLRRGIGADEVDERIRPWGVTGQPGGPTRSEDAPERK
jgi:capsular exopolysaccharide synthesis family protein